MAKLRKRQITSEAETVRGQRAIVVRGARTHNLKSVDIDLPHHQLTVITGVSGSGKSSLAFDTIFAEGQRQYMESLSLYARQYLQQLQRPDIDSIEGLQPTLCIDQRQGQANPRSTVATVTEVYDYLRLLMARVGVPTCYQCGVTIKQQSPAQILHHLSQLPEGAKLIVMAPVVRGRRGGHRDEFNLIRKAGLVKVRVDGVQYDIDSVPELKVRQNHTIEAIVDKLVLREGVSARLADSLQTALQLADGLVVASYQLPTSVSNKNDMTVATQSLSEKGSDPLRQGEELNEIDSPPKGQTPFRIGSQWTDELFSTKYACPNCGVNYAEVEPRTFSFNSPYGACPQCDGVGEHQQFDPEWLIADWKKSPAEGAIAIVEAADTANKRKLRKRIEALLESLGSDWNTPLSSLKPSYRNRFLLGDAPPTVGGLIGILEAFEAELEEDQRSWCERFKQHLLCNACQGSRLRPEALAIRLDNRSIFEICSLSIRELEMWLAALQFNAEQQLIARPILNEMSHRVRFLNKVGLGYLTLARSADTLSGGELQRVRLATSIGSGLIGVSYILDEPSIGLHQRDNDRLIESLKDLQQQGNTVIVVEHDESMMRACQYLVDMGPGAGKRGGQIVACGTPQDVIASPSSLTAAYLRGELSIPPTENRHLASQQPRLVLRGASLHNLRKVTLEVPLGCLVGITGVSGSGKSSLIGETLVPALSKQLGHASGRIGPYESLTGFEPLDKLIEITQEPIGRTPRSTPATYCGVFDWIREVWANTRDAKQRGYSASRFSFNTGDGRCPQCQGQGQVKIEMHFLPDLFVPCSACNGQRYNRQTLQVRYRERSIADALNMSVDEAVEFFTNFSKVSRYLASLQQVGLGYIQLGQSSSTLSGGEAQRIKLATELARSETGKTIYFLDEPTTGLHFADVQRLMSVLRGLVDRGNTVIVIEHNLDVIRACDWLVDLGPDGGQGGGQIVAAGTPEQVAASATSITGRYLAG